MIKLKPYFWNDVVLLNDQNFELDMLSTMAEDIVDFLVKTAKIKSDCERSTQGNFILYCDDPRQETVLRLKYPEYVM